MRPGPAAAILLGAWALSLAGCHREPANPAPRAGDEMIGPDGGMLVWVPPGAFLMGTGSGLPDEAPVHRVCIDQGFWIGKYPVTNGQYRQFCQETGRHFPVLSDQPDNYPVMGVTWWEAQAYCRLNGLRLPTEAEWEYAARAATDSKFPWGDEWRDGLCCNKLARGPGGKTFPVGSFPANASWCGAEDMAGNVWEWCADWYAWWYYDGSPVNDPRGPADGKLRVLRGGSWDDYRGDCASTFRNAARPGRRKDTYGFRCAMSAA